MRLEDRVSAGLDLCFGGGDQRQDEVLEGALGAVVRVQGNGNGVLGSDGLHEVRHRERTGCAVLDRVAGEVIGATGGDLDDTV